MAGWKTLRSKNAYNIGWVVILSTERFAATALLDQRHDQPLDFVADEFDHNTYIWGSMSGHNIVIASILTTSFGLPNTASDIARGLVTSCPHVKISLLIGIGAGAPENGRGIRLGDVAVTQPLDTSGSDTQHDVDEAKNVARKRTDELARSPEIILKALRSLQSKHEVSPSQIPSILQEARGHFPDFFDYGYPGSQYNHLFEGVHGGDEKQELECSTRLDTAPTIHYEHIESGNGSIKDITTRQSVSTASEAIGLTNDFPGLVVRGICDDTYGDLWQCYASATAAAFAKEFLLYLPKGDVARTRSITNILREANLSIQMFKHRFYLKKQRTRDEKVAKLLRRLHDHPYAERKDSIPKRTPDTCVWFTQHELVKAWLEGKTSNILWASADPGTGKSVLARYLVDEVLPNESRSICYFFFNVDSQDQDNAAHVASAMLHKILMLHPDAFTDLVIEDLEAYYDQAIESFPRLWSILTGLDQSIVGEVICVIDALDECKSRDRVEIIHAMCGGSSTNRVKILFLSRPYIEIERGFSDPQLRIPVLHLSGENEDESIQISQEIDLVIRHRLGKLAAQQSLREDEFALLEKEFLSIPHRTYLWAHLALSLLEDTPDLTKQSMHKILADLPVSLEDAYEKILQRSPDPVKTRIILQIVLAASRPLTVKEMNLLLALDGQVLQNSEPSNRFQHSLRQHCGLFIIVIDQRVCLLHQTARKFLLRKPSSQFSLSNPVTSPALEESSTNWQGSISESGAHYVLAERCIRAFQTRDIAELSLSLGVYCADYWAYHFRTACISNADTINDEALAFCDVDSSMFRRWWPLYKENHECPDESELRLSQIILPAAFGLDSLIQRIFLNSSVLDQASLTKALYLSSQAGFESIFRLLTARMNFAPLDDVIELSDLSSSSSKEDPSAMVQQKNSTTTTPQHVPHTDESAGHRGRDDRAFEPAYTSGSQAMLISQYGVEAIAQSIAEKTPHLNRMDLSTDQTNRLRDLLQEFALRFGHDRKVSTGFEEDENRGKIMKFIHMEAQRIAEAFGLIITRDPYRKVSLGQKMNIHPHNLAEPSESIYAEETFSELPVHGTDHTQYTHDEEHDIEAVNSDKSTDNENSMHPSIGITIDLVHGSPAFRWLINSISNEFKLQGNIVSNAIDSIRSQILKIQVKGETVSHSRRPRTVSFFVTTEWDPGIFVQEQVRGLKERIHPHLAGETEESIFHGTHFINLPELGQTITITGEPINAQAITCEEYLNLVWPETGVCVLETLKEVFLEPHKAKGETLPNGTGFFPVVTKSGLVVEVIGEIHAIAETVGILAWLTSALRSSPFREEGICTVKPKISIKETRGHNKDNNVASRHYANLTYELQRIILVEDSAIHGPRDFIYTVDDIVNEQVHKPGDLLHPAHLIKSTQGLCWHKMFHNPVLVLDYPIRRRDQHEAGLETNLDIISTLIGTHNWIMLNSKLYIKGFAAMAIPTGREMNSLKWHYIYSKDGQYLGFEQDKVQHEIDIDPHRLENYRHFLGWYSETKSNAGAKWDSFAYNVRRSGLKPPRAETAVKGFTLSTGWSGWGATVGGAVTCTVGHKDPPLRAPFSGEHLLENLREIQKQAVVLWDTSTKRGWLVDGLSALLHLIRATAVERWNDDFKDYFRLRADQLVEPKGNYPSAAKEFFTEPNFKNMRVDLEFSRHGENGKEINLTMRSLTDYFFNVLIHAAEAQSKLRYREGYYSDFHYRAYLDGWDFCSLVKDRQRFVPVSQALHCRTLPWVDFIRSANAVILFGAGFGEIIEPTGSKHELCSNWSRLPEDHNYLATRHDTLEWIVDRSGGDLTAVPIKLTPDLIWFHPSATLSSCSCDGRTTASHQHTVQAVMPKPKKWQKWNQKIEYKKIALPVNGAVVFGRHNKKLFHWFYDDNGEPVEGMPPEHIQSESPSTKSNALQALPKRAISKLNPFRREGR